jgi:hypothetical protein
MKESKAADIRLIIASRKRGKLAKKSKPVKKLADYALALLDCQQQYNAQISYLLHPAIYMIQQKIKNL